MVGYKAIQEGWWRRERGGEKRKTEREKIGGSGVGGEVQGMAVGTVVAGICDS